MKEKLADKARVNAAQHLGPDEQIQVTTFGYAGSVSRPREMAKMAGMMILTGIATGGLVGIGVSKRPRPVYIAGTNHRVLLFANSALGAPSALSSSLPLAALAVVQTEHRRRGVLAVVLAVGGADESLELAFGKANHEEATALAHLVSTAPSQI